MADLAFLKRIVEAVSNASLLLLILRIVEVVPRDGSQTVTTLFPPLRLCLLSIGSLRNPLA